MDRPLPKPCHKTPACRKAGGCQECFKELLEKPRRKSNIVKDRHQKSLLMGVLMLARSIHDVFTLKGVK
jgi:hypothetical protein